MILVADSGPLHYLILFVPDAVASELESAGSPPAVSAWISRPPSWVTVTPVPPEQLKSVTDDLDSGERAAIALAGAIHADLLLIDDAAGRAEARRRNLRVTGTLGVLRAGAERGLVDVPDALSRLRARPPFYSVSGKLLSNRTRSTCRPEDRRPCLVTSSFRAAPSPPSPRCQALRTPCRAWRPPTDRPCQAYRACLPCRTSFRRSGP